MIGRYKDTSIYRQLLQMNEFYRLAGGAALTLSSYILRLSGFTLPADILALAAVTILGGPIIVEAAKGIARRELNVDELVSLAMIAAVVIGEYLSAAVVALIMVTGSLLEQVTAQKARSAIDALIRLAPDKATILEKGRERQVAVTAIRPGQHLLIRSGEKVPVDGRVLSGSANLDQASLTGESSPVEKSEGDRIYAGTVIYAGMLEIEAEKVGDDTTLGRLIRLVQDAEKQKAPILRIADRFAGYFTPIIITLGLLVYLLSGDIYRAITVLIVGCPCAFILASPTAIVAALGNASKQGILIKGGAIIEETSRVNAVLLDKTGTMTTGNPLVRAVLPLNGMTGDEVITLAASVERYSTHPLARAIIAAAEERGQNLHDCCEYKDIAGAGVEASVQGRRYTVGKIDDLTFGRYEHAFPPGCSPQRNKIIMLSENNLPLGLLFLEEELRRGTETLTAKLAASGIDKVQMLTGDEECVAARVAAEAGIESYSAGILPGQKLEKVKELQDEGYKVAMVGDGINDAPALAAADIGIAMGAMGTDAAIEAADVALMGDDLAKLPLLFTLSGATVRTIGFNIFFALAFNLLALAASGAGLLTPITGAITHNIGSVIVIANSARLNRS